MRRNMWSCHINIFYYPTIRKVVSTCLVSFDIFTPATYYWKEEMGPSYSTIERNEKYMQNFSREI